MIWLTYKCYGYVYVVIQPARSIIRARLLTAVHGLVNGEFLEGHKVDKNSARRIPNTMIGRMLSAKEARNLRKKLAIPTT